MKRKTLPLGYSDFKRLRQSNHYYVDKSLFIKEMWDRGDLILQIPRPRRFGKTLNMSMLYYFFGKNAPGGPEENRGLFSGLAIEKAGQEYIELRGRFPVIFLSFKDAKALTGEECFSIIYSLIREEYKKHLYLLEGEKALTGYDRVFFCKIIENKAAAADYHMALKNLLIFLYTYHNEKVILLIDEYDAPIQAGYTKGYYDQIVSFMRNFLSGGLKDTDQYLEKSMLTGIMRVSQESIFSGLNNVGVFTLLSHAFSDKFGFTEKEVAALLRDYDLLSRQKDVRLWYNGYVFGKTTVYNPWSIVQYASKPEDGLAPYWINTSDNKLIEELLIQGGFRVQEELTGLMEGKALTKFITSNIIFPDLKNSEDLLWSFLLFGGYLKQTGKIRVGIADHYHLSIPNEEVKYTYSNLVRRYFSNRIENKNVRTMLKALVEGELDIFEEIFSNLVIKCLSYYDIPEREAENVYHAFTAGLLVWLSGSYRVKSNRESGYGRFDIMLIPVDKSKGGLIIEFKVVRKKETLESAAQSAFQQIEDMKYATELLDEGINEVRKLAIVFEGKKVLVKEKEEK